MSQYFGSSSKEDDSDWLSVSDLMAGLMVIFLFIAIVFIQSISQQKERVRDIAVAWQENEVRIYEALQDEFEDDLQRWNAEIEQETLLVRFKSPEVLFAEGRSTLRRQFRVILDDFFPRYVRVLSEFENSLDEVRVEGHTSSDWDGASPDEAYYRNMGLSQARTREVLRHVLSIPEIRGDLAWLRPLLTANGLSSSRLVYDANDVEDQDRSRRVEFRIRTKARTEIVKILEEIN